MFTVNLKETRNPGWDRLNEQIKKLNGRKASVRAGVIKPQAAKQHLDSDITVGELAVIQEYGVPGHIQARSFVKAPFKKHLAEYKDALRALPPSIMDGQDTYELLDLVGKKMAHDMKSAIFDGIGIPPPNAPSTIKRKGFDHPLLETTELMESISHEVLVPK